MPKKVILMAEKVLAQDKTVPEDVLHRITAYRKSTFKPTVVKLLQSTKESKLKTIVHGDFWSNNMMINDDDPGKQMNYIG